MSDDDDMGFFEKGSSAEETSSEESSDSSLSDEEVFDDGYGSDLMGDEADRARLAQMTELEREKILYERREKRREMQERLAARRAARKAEKERKKKEKKKKGQEKKKKKDKKKKKKKAKDEDEEYVDEGDESGGEEEAQPERRKTRSQTEAERSAGKKRTKEQALADLLARKEGRVATTRTEEFDEGEGDAASGSQAQEEEEGGRAKKRRKKGGDDDDFVVDEEQEDRERARRVSRRSSSGVAPMDEEEEKFLTEEEKKLRALRAVRGETETPLTLNHVISIQLRRAALERIIDEPYFDEYVTGKFVRINVGQRDDGTPAYRLAEVVRVENYKTKYKFGRRPDYQRGLLLRHGKAERVFPMSLVSNHSVTQTEFDRWKAECERVGVRIPSAEEALERKRIAEYKRATFRYTNETVEELIERKRKQPDAWKHMNLAMERARIQDLLDTAKELGNEEKAKEYQKQLDELEEYISRVKRNKAKQSASAQMIEKINAKNRTAMMQDLQKLSKLSEEQARQRIINRQHDLFSRRPTQPAAEEIDVLASAADVEGVLTAATPSSSSSAAAAVETKRDESKDAAAAVVAPAPEKSHAEGKRAQPVAAATVAASVAVATTGVAPMDEREDGESSSSSSKAAAARPRDSEDEEDDDEEEDEKQYEGKTLQPAVAFRSALFPGATLPMTPSDRLRERQLRQSAAFSLDREHFDPDTDKLSVPQKKKPRPPSRGMAQPPGTIKITLQEYVARLEEETA